MTDIIYVSTNRAMPGPVKIGRTSGRVEDRIGQLGTTGVPLPFECCAAWEVSDGRVAKRALRIAFGDYRIRDRRMLFRREIVSLSSAALTVAQENGKNWVSNTGAGYWKYEDTTLWDLRGMGEADD